MKQELLKIAVIHGEALVDSKNRNGQIDYINCPIDDESFHIFLMIDYLKEHYKDNKELQAANIYTSINTIAIKLQRLGSIVFLNTTNYRKEMLQKHGRHGIVIMPDVITDEQKEALQELKQKVSKYNEIQIWYDITDEGQAQMLFGDANVIDEFVKRKTR